MNREDRRVTEAYVQAVLSEREQCLYQNALNKVRVITRSMKPAEKEEYLQSDSFRNTLRQLKRRDRIYQGLLHNELVQPGARSELDRLSRLIAGELQAGRKVNLPFLRTVEKSHVPLEKAYQAIREVRDGILRRWIDEQMGSLTLRAENKIVLWMRTGDAASCLRGEETEISVVRRVMEKSFPGGLTEKNTAPAFRPGTLDSFIRFEACKSFPELQACRNVRTPSGESVSAGVNRETERGGRLVLNALNRRFSRERIRRLLERNPELIRLQKQQDAAGRREKRIRAALLDAIPEHYRDLYPLARQMKRHFFLHLGPTNSGKTYDGVQRLRGAENGLYLGPLPLLPRDGRGADPGALQQGAVLHRGNGRPENPL